MCTGGLSGESKNHIFGKVSIPGDLSRSAGGSSGGEAALIAAKCSVAGIGSDIAGSLRNPAQACGITALKPSSERFPARGPIPTTGVPGNRACWGPMARSVDDLALMMAAMCDEESVQLDINCIPLKWS